MKKLEAEGYELIIADECLFSPNSYDKSKHWSKAGYPVRKLKKFAPQKPVMAFGAISSSFGNILYHLDTRSFNSKDMEKILRMIRNVCGEEKKLALVWDNASYHRAYSV